jgi:hypothetical protein
MKRYFPRILALHNKIAGLRLKKLILLLILLFLIVPAGCRHSKPLSFKPGETIRGTFQVDAPGPFYIGDSIPLLLTVEAKPGFVVQLPELNTPTLGGLELRKKVSTVTEVFPGGSRQTARYIFTGWQVGQYTIPEMVVNYQTPSQVNKTLLLSPYKIELHSVLPKNKSEAKLLVLNIKGLKYPLGLTPRYSLLKWFLLGILIVILVLLFIWSFARHIEKSHSADLPKVEPAHIIALRRLTNLKEMSLQVHDDYKVFYCELSECLREYMENRYLIRALEMTTEEFLASLTKGEYLNKDQQGLLTSILQQSDLVKFAGQIPPKQQAEQALIQIEQLVEATKEIPAPGTGSSSDTNTSGENLFEESLS